MVAHEPLVAEALVRQAAVSKMNVMLVDHAPWVKIARWVLCVAADAATTREPAAPYETRCERKACTRRSALRWRVGEGAQPLAAATD